MHALKYSLKGLSELPCFAGLKKIGAYFYPAPYLHQTSFRGAQNIVFEIVCVAIILLQKLLEI